MLATLAFITNSACLLAAKRMLFRALGTRAKTTSILASLTVCAFLQALFLRERQGSLTVAVFLVLTAVIAVSAFTDIATGYVLDSLTLPALGVALAAGAASDQLVTVIAGASAGALSILVLFAISAGNGVGLGDAKLAACVGALLGVERGCVAIGIAFVAGGAYAAFLLITHQASRKDSLPLAPFLAAGVLATLAFRPA